MKAAVTACPYAQAVCEGPRDPSSHVLQHCGTSTLLTLSPHTPHSCMQRCGQGPGQPPPSLPHSLPSPSLFTLHSPQLHAEHCEGAAKVLGSFTRAMVHTTQGVGWYMMGHKVLTASRCVPPLTDQSNLRAIAIVCAPAAPYNYLHPSLYPL